MFSLKHLTGLLLTSLLFASCTPSTPYRGVPNPNAPQPIVEKTKTPAELKKEEQLRKERIKANAEAKARRDALRKKKEAEQASGGSTGGGSEEIKPVKREPIKRPSSAYRTAVSMPGKPGFVFNPWTNQAVDVRGLPSGQLIRDPNDGNPDHKFRVP